MCVPRDDTAGGQDGATFVPSRFKRRRPGNSGARTRSGLNAFTRAISRSITLYQAPALGQKPDKQHGASRCPHEARFFCRRQTTNQGQGNKHPTALHDKGWQGRATATCFSQGGQREPPGRTFHPKISKSCPTNRPSLTLWAGSVAPPQGLGALGTLRCNRCGQVLLPSQTANICRKVFLSGSLQ